MGPFVTPMTFITPLDRFRARKKVLKISGFILFCMELMLTKSWRLRFWKIFIWGICMEKNRKFLKCPKSTFLDGNRLQMMRDAQKWSYFRKWPTGSWFRNQGNPEKWELYRDLNRKNQLFQKCFVFNFSNGNRLQMVWELQNCPQNWKWVIISIFTGGWFCIFCTPI